VSIEYSDTYGYTAPDYGLYNEGFVASNDLLSGISDEAWITGFTATSSVPASTTLEFLFSVDNLNWYNSSGEKGVWEAVANGTASFDLQAFDWSTSGLSTSSLNFYYKARFYSNIATVTPIIYDASVEYATSGSYTPPDYGYYNEGIYVSNILVAERANEVQYFGYNLTSLPASTTAHIMFSNDGVDYYSATGTAFYWSDLSSGDHLATSSGFDLAGFSWTRDLYYKIKLASNIATATPVISEVKAYFTERDPVEFVSIIDPDSAEGTDYSSLSAWQDAVKSDLTSTSTLVFSYDSDTAVGVFPDSSVLVGQTSGATGTLVHLTGTSSIASKQLLISGVVGKFQNGERVYIEGASDNYIYLTTSGDTVIAVAECRSTEGTADVTAVTIDGWTTASTTYIKIWTDPDDPYGRHNGVWDEGKYRLEYITTEGYENIINIKESYTTIDGLQIKLTNSYYNGHGFNVTEVGIDKIILKNNIIQAVTLGVSRGVYKNYDGDFYFYNNIIYGFNYTTSCGIYFVASIYAYNNTILDCATGIYYSGSSGTRILVNNITQDCDVLCYYSVVDLSEWASNNISSDGTAFGTNSKTTTTVKFLDATNNDFHLDPTDTAARNAGTSTQASDAWAQASDAYYDDIDGTARGSAWDIGADEVPVEFISTICENTSAGGDCLTDMDYNTLGGTGGWESSVECDLTATSTRVFSGTITGNLSNNNIITLYRGAESIATGTVVATTSDQILVDTIRRSTSALECRK
jgi:hypothetical protein